MKLLFTLAPLDASHELKAECESKGIDETFHLQLIII